MYDFDGGLCAGAGREVAKREQRFVGDQPEDRACRAASQSGRFGARRDEHIAGAEGKALPAGDKVASGAIVA
jgi:hypothetical protein